LTNDKSGRAGERARVPVPVTDTAAALAAKAPHPHAAMLFIDFLLSRDAQLIYRDLGYLSSRKDMKSDEYPWSSKMACRCRF
jgi:ABC-type Fe3+ transport system substrate-binding protein